MDVVKEHWVTGDDSGVFLRWKQKVKKIKAALSKWSRECFGDIIK